MILKISLTQLLRTPVKTGLLAILLCLSVLFACVGVTLLSVSNTSLAQLDAQFTTIGTLEQVPNTVEIVGLWDAAQQKYIYYDSPQYDESIPISVMEIAGCNYLDPPIHFPFYVVRNSILQGFLNPAKNGGLYILEARPLTDCVPDQPVEMEIVNVLFGDVGTNQTFYFCDHYNSTPQSLYADTIYLMGLTELHMMHEGYEGHTYELCPLGGPFLSQDNRDGTPVFSRDQPSSYIPLTKNFYETSEGKIWLNQLSLLENVKYCIPVIPTNATHLIMAFHQQRAVISQGRDITQEEYDSGAKVCLVSGEFLGANHLKIGDRVSFPFIFSQYRDSANLSFGHTYELSLNAKGEEYQPFFEAEYTIVGTYRSRSEPFAEYDLAPFSVIVPYHSIPQDADENNIMATGPMQGFNTVFEIPNGTIDQFMEAFSAAGIENIKVQFYDNGYSEIKAGLDNLSAVAWVLFASGLAVFLAVAFFFAYSLISRNARRFALERALGASRKQCIRSAVSAFLLVGAASAALGAAGSYWVSRGLFAAAMGESGSMFDTAYSVWVNAADAVVVPEWLTQASVSPWPLALGGLAAVVVLAAIALAFTNKATSREPMELLQNE